MADMGGNKTSLTRERPARDRGWDFSGINGDQRRSRPSGGGPRRLSPGIVIACLGFVALLAAAYGYDRSRRDLIRDGVRVAGIDVGGMRADAARDKLGAALRPKLIRPVHVRVAARRFSLSARRAGISLDLDGMVDEALAESRSEVLPVRVFKDLVGQGSDADLPAEVNFSRLAVRRFVRSIKSAIDRPPRDAAVEFKTTELPVVPSQTGLTVKRSDLRRAVVAGLDGAGRERSVRAKVKVTQPKVTSDELAPKYPVVVTVNRSTFRLKLFKKLRLSKTYTIAVGQVGYDTPAGLYRVQDKTVNPTWNVPNKPWAGDLAGKVIPGGAPDNPLKARWLGFYDGAGIHGTSDIGSLGSAASHGCIRMSIPDVIELYPQVPVGAPVFIS